MTASKLCAMEHLIPQEVNGSLFKLGNSPELRAAVTRITLASKLFAKMSRGARDTYLLECQPCESFNELMRIHEDAFAERPLG